MKRAISSVLLTICIGAWANTSQFDQITAKALAGDYQAQRNLAFGYSSSPYDGQEKNPMLACAWRLVILNSGSPKVDDTDVSNKQLYCGRLNADQLSAATAQARNLYRTVYRTKASF